MPSSTDCDKLNKERKKNSGLVRCLHYCNDGQGLVKLQHSEQR